MVIRGVHVVSNPFGVLVMPNLSILDLLDFCKVNVENANGTVVEEIDINSCQT